MTSPLRYAMIGGGKDAFIGAVHRKAMALDSKYTLTAAALSSDPAKAIASGEALGLPKERNHGTWQELLAHELTLPQDRRVQVVVIVTPNHQHFPIAHAFVEAGFHVVCDKPLVHTSAEAEQLLRAQEKAGTIFAVTYNYTGYPLVREARHRIACGQLGTIRKVIVEYSQGWLAKKIDAANKQALWRIDTARSGVAGCIGDIGSHAENLVATVTGLELEALCADLTHFGENRILDDDGNMLLRFKGGAKGVLISSQISIGGENALSLRVFGDKATLVWRQENPNELFYTEADAPTQILTRNAPYLCDKARAACRLPTGHPEGFIEAFANLYAGIFDAILAHEAGQAFDNDNAFPTLKDGARGVRFIEKTVASSASSQKWTAF